MAIRRIDLLSCGSLNKTPMKTLDFDAHEFSTMGIHIFAKFVKNFTSTNKRIFCKKVYQ